MDVKLGNVGDLDIEVAGGKVMLKIAAKLNGADVSVGVALDAKFFLDKLAAAIPGTLDDTIISLLEAALLK